MQKLLLATATAALAAGAASAEDIKMGILLGFTGPLESITPNMANGAELAIAEVNAAGTLLGGGNTVVAVRADGTCIDAAAAQSAMEGLVTGDGIRALMGSDCSGVTGAVLQNVARPNGILMVSPSATSPGLTTAEDDGLFFRTAPSDARQGVVIAETLIERGITSIAISYTNNDYGKGLSDSVAASFRELGGTVTIEAPHEDGRADYSAEVAALAAAGGDALVVAGYTDQGGKGVIQASLDTGAFDVFVLPDGMVGAVIAEELGEGLANSFGIMPGSDSNSQEVFFGLAEAAGFDGTSTYAGESYDAAALIMLAWAAAGSTDSAAAAAAMYDIANAPGEPIMPGELAKALELIAAGTDIDYVGATAVELLEPGEPSGNFREVEFVDGQVTTVGFR